MLGVPFDDRGPRADDALRALRVSLGRRTPAYHGVYYDYENFVVEPHATTEQVPIWVGGRSRRSLRRALELADGWSPFRLQLDEIVPMLDGRREEIEARGLDLIFPPDAPLDPIDDPDDARARVAAYRAAGATGLALRFRHTSRAHYERQLESFLALV